MKNHVAKVKNKAVQLLRWSERFTRTDNSYLAKNAALLISTQAISVMNGFIIYILISHFVEKEVYGQYKYFLSLFSLFSVFTFTGIEVSLGGAVAKGMDGSFLVGFKRKLVGGLTGSIFVLIGAGYYASNSRSDLASALVLLSIFAPFIYASSLYGIFLNGMRRFTTYTILNIATTLASSFGMIIAFILLHDPIQLFAAFLITSLVTVAAYIYSRKFKRNDQIDPGFLSLATHLSGLDILGIVANNIDGVLIYHFLGASSLAIYSFATIPVEQMKGFLKSIQSVAIPKLVVSQVGVLQQTLTRKLWLFILSISGLMGIYILLSPWFFRLFFPTYISSVPYSQIYSLSLIFAVPAGLLATMFMAKGMRKEATWFNVLNYILQIVLLLIGAWLYGLWGAIVARLVSRTLMFFTAHAIFQRANPIQAE